MSDPHDDHERSNFEEGLKAGFEHPAQPKSDDELLEAAMAEISGEADGLAGIGEVKLGENGLELPVDLSHDVEAPEPLTITSDDLAALAIVEAELDTRNSEVEIDPTLERVELLMDLLGNPERSFPVIQVAGTNGKSSTVRMIESILRAFHRRTGRITSPQLQMVTENIAIDGQPIHPRDFVRIYEEIKPYIEMVDEKSVSGGGPRMSKFEVIISMAYAAFADAPVEVAVIECGMGGTWDATNVVNADVAVITPVGLDHQGMLGETLAEIAAQKAGIIKSRWDADDLLTPPDNVTIVAEQEPEAMEAILERAIAVDSAVARAGSEFGVAAAGQAIGGQQLTLRGLGGEYDEIFLPLFGEHQARNAAVALAAVEAFFGAGAGRQLDKDIIREGLGTVHNPGRLERVRSTPAVLIDAAHNPHGAKALAGALSSSFAFDRLIGVVGVLGDKDASGILSALEPVLSEVVITQTQSPRALHADDLAEYARDIFGEERVHVTYNLPGAIELAVELAEEADIQSGAGVVITGSVVTAGEARTLFGKEPQ